MRNLNWKTIVAIIIIAILIIAGLYILLNREPELDKTPTLCYLNENWEDYVGTEVTLEGTIHMQRSRYEYILKDTPFQNEESFCGVYLTHPCSLPSPYVYIKLKGIVEGIETFDDGTHVRLNNVEFIN